MNVVLLDKRPRWFMCGAGFGRVIWRRGPADYLHLWPDGRYRKQRPVCPWPADIEWRGFSCYSTIRGADIVDEEGVKRPWP